jgi:hypothetical protein
MMSVMAIFRQLVSETDYFAIACRRARSARDKGDRQ